MLLEAISPPPEVIVSALEEFGLAEDVELEIALKALQRAWTLKDYHLARIVGNPLRGTEGRKLYIECLLALKSALTECTESHSLEERYHYELKWLTTRRSGLGHQTPYQVLAQGDIRKIPLLVLFILDGDTEVLHPRVFLRRGVRPGPEHRRLTWKPEDGPSASMGFRVANPDAPVGQQYLEPISPMAQFRIDTMLWNMRQPRRDKELSCAV